MKKKTLLAISIFVLFLALGGFNIFKKATWKEPYDGVVWEEKPRGLTALKVEMDSPAYLRGIKKGDILFKINDKMVINYYTAKRLALTLGRLVKVYEDRFGELKLNVTEREK